jgi:hypothetical protein
MSTPYAADVRYEDPPQLSHEAAPRALGAALEGRVTEHEPSSVLMGLALYDRDRDFVESWAVRVGDLTSNSELRDTAALAIGHLARRFGKVGTAARAFVVQAATDPDSDGRACDAADDISQFAPE